MHRLVSPSSILNFSQGFRIDRSRMVAACMLKFTKSISVSDRCQEAHFGRLVEVGAVHEEPGRGHVG